MRAPPPRLIAITDIAGRGATATLDSFEALCSRAQPGTVALLLRDKELPARERLDWARKLRMVTQRYKQMLLVAERLDIALLGAADGLHLGERSVVPSDVRTQIAARHLWLTRAWHDPDAEPDESADAFLLSPIVAARKGTPPHGWDGLTRGVRKAQGRHVYALGGLGAANVAAADQSGAIGISVIASAYEEPDALISALRLCL